MKTPLITRRGFSILTVTLYHAFFPCNKAFDVVHAAAADILITAGNSAAIGNR